MNAVNTNRKKDNTYFDLTSWTETFLSIAFSGFSAVSYTVSSSVCRSGVCACSRSSLSSSSTFSRTFGPISKVTVPTINGNWKLFFVKIKTCQDNLGLLILLIKASTCVCFCVCADHTCFYEKSKKDRNLVHSGKGFHNNLSCY